MTMRQRNAVELSGGMKQADSGRRVVRDVSLSTFFRGEGRVAHPLHRSGTSTLPARRIRTFRDLLNRFPDCPLQVPRGKKPPAG
jgi:hypothetical protein